MNAVRAVVHLSFRGYRSSNRGGGRISRRNNAGLGEMTMPESEVFSKNFAVDDNEDFEDVDKFESDFRNVGKYDKMHEREMEVKKEKLLTQIVKRQYFKNEDPPMLTWAEKEQIRLLHEEDPVDWSEDRLAESFPATRDTIVKVLRAKWSPKSVKVVTRYDEEVKKNWDLYKAGKLKVTEELRSHLAQFKDRKIEPMDPEEIAKRFIKPKPVFPKPKSTMFSSIIQRYLDAHPESRDDEETSEESAGKSLAQITSGQTLGNDSKALEVTTKLQKLSHHKLQGKLLTFDDFLKDRVENVQGSNMTPVDRVLVDEYKLRKAEVAKDRGLVFESESAVSWANGGSKKAQSNEAKCLIFDKTSPGDSANELDESNKRLDEIAFSGNRDLARKQEETKSIGVNRLIKYNETGVEANVQKDLSIVDKSNLETGIITRHKKNDPLHSEYPEYIKIPAKKFKEGVTYRVQDRYYDDDGEFLYRVIGIKS